MEKNLFHCIPQRKKTSSAVSHNVGKPLLLYPTMGKNLSRYIPQRRKISSIVGYNGRKPAALWNTMQKIFLRCIPQFFCVVLWDTVHCIRFCYGVGYNRRKTPALWDTTEKFVTHPEIFFLCVLQRKKLLPLYPTTEENLLHCVKRAPSMQPPSEDAYSFSYEAVLWL